MTSHVDDEQEDFVIRGMATRPLEPSIKKGHDPFGINLEVSKTLRGVNRNCSRRIDTKIKKSEEKLPEGSDASSKQILPGMVFRNGYGAFDVMIPPYNQTELAQYYETSFANHASVDAKVSNMVGLGYHWALSDKAISLMETKNSEKEQSAARKKVERLKVRLTTWLDDLNDDETFIGTLEKLVTDLQAVGNGYLEIGRKSTGEVGYVGHIPAVSVRVRRQKDGFCQIVGDKVVFFKNYGEKVRGNPVTTDPQPNEIMHLKMYSPLNTYYGVPDIVSAGQAVIGDIFAQQYNIDYFENKAVPRYLVTVKGAKLSEASEDKLFNFMQTNLKGQNHRTLVVPLPPDNEQTKVEFKMEAIEAGIQEGSFGKYHESNRNDILSAHQVPLSKIGMGDGSLAGTIASDRTFREQVARPAQRMLEKRVSRIIAEVTDVLELKLNELTLTDEAAQAQTFEKYVRNQILTPNEARDKLGYPHREGGDEPLELNPRQTADAKNEATGNDSRATDRENNAADSPNTVSGRNPKGDGEKK